MQISIELNPYKIDALVGQPIALKYLKNYSKNKNKLPPLLIFHGPAGVGKMYAADIFSKSILCLNGDSCGICQSCKMFQKNVHPDYILFPESEKIAIGDIKNPEIFTVRWLQSQRVIYKPSVSSVRMIVIPDATKINTEAETALLKTLEEASDHTRFIFVVDDINSLKSTIRSRGVEIPFYYLSKNSMDVISERNGLFIPEFTSGSYDLAFLDIETWNIFQEKVENSIFESIQLLHLEGWIKAYKTNHSEWKEDFDYKKFLDIISSLMIYSYSKNHERDFSACINALFEFKNLLHKDINAMENFSISRLFHKLSLIVH
jgi:DNA polymerase-3 subunit gamma/tau